MRGNIDDMMSDFEAREEERAAKERGEDTASASSARVLIGSVDHFYDKLGVAAIKLTGSLKVGDMIEVEDEDFAIRQRVDSMQIDRQDVAEAQDGDDVGIRLRARVSAGSAVYRL